MVEADQEAQHKVGVGDTHEQLVYDTSRVTPVQKLSSSNLYKRSERQWPSERQQSQRNVRSHQVHGLKVQDEVKLKLDRDRGSTNETAKVMAQNAAPPRVPVWDSPVNR